MDNPDLQARLMKTFLVEMEDHVATLNRALLQLEKETAAERRAELVRSLFRAAHSLKGAARSVGQAGLEGCCQHLESVFAAARAGAALFDDDLLRLLYATTDAIEALGQALAQALPADRLDAELHRLGQRLRAMAAPWPQSSSGEPAAVADMARVAGPSPPAATSAGRAAQDLGSLSGEVRVSGDKLDSLLAMTGELQVARMRGQLQSDDIDRLKSFVQAWREDWTRAFPVLTRLTGQAANGTASPRADNRKARRAFQVLADTGDRLERLDRELEQLRRRGAADRKELETAAVPIERTIRQIRMLPFHQACDGLPRAVRDLAMAGGRQVSLTVEGGELELDRSILEKLRSPLLQLVRNAVDHGIEAADVREAAGKAPEGRIVVSAVIEGNRVQVCVADDGRGLDLAAVADRSRRGGLAIPSDQEAVAALIFEPGVSTAQAVTALSGRGVGLDVVKTTVTALRGTVSVTSQPGVGTRFVLSLPLTLSAFSALLMRVGTATFAVELENALRVLTLSADEIVPADGRHVVVVGQRQVPVIALAELLQMKEARAEGPAAGDLTAVLLADGLRQLAVLVDEIVGNHELVVKPLGERLDGVKFVTGAAVLPDGDLALTVSASALIAGFLRLAPGSVARRPVETQQHATKRLLVVEDSMTTRLLVASVLEASGYTVEAAADGLGAWEVLEARDVDLVVSDVEMPRMDGILLTGKMRATARTRDIPVILLTARESDSDRLRGMQAGADAYLTKSAFDQAALLETIQRLLP